MNHSESVPRLIISSGEPAGIGPDLSLMSAAKPWAAKMLVVGSAELFRQRAESLNLNLKISTVTSIDFDQIPPHQPGHVVVFDTPLGAHCVAGSLDRTNAPYVLELLKLCADSCLKGLADAMVTAPVHKGIINDAGIPFSGHTEFLAHRTDAEHPVMLLCTDSLRVALATTHLPLKDVSAAITPRVLIKTLRILREGLISQFGFENPRISVCGLNPHAGESGHLGREEIEVIEPTLAKLRSQHNWILHGPLPADTLFTERHLAQCDAVLAMYHDQGLPVLKYAGFGSAINVTLGLPIIRTSVDHGTAVDLAATGQCDDGSMMAAIELAINNVRSQ